MHPRFADRGRWPRRVATLAASGASAQASAVDEIAKYRAALQDGNPAELWEARGEGLWKQPRGPKKVSLERCDLGPRTRRGQGRLRAAAAVLRRRRPRDGPRDAARLVHGQRCRASPRPMRPSSRSATASRKSDIEALVAYVASESRGVKMNVSLADPKEQEAYDIGEKMFYLPRRHARFRVRDLPWRGRQADPPAGPAEPDRPPRARRRPTRPGPRTACRRASCARSSGG